jgi:hypothetical protein
MKCLRCWAESKYEFCRKCKEQKHKAGAIISQNKAKLKNLLDLNILQPELFSKFILYTDNIITHGKIYMEFKSQKQYVLYKFIAWTSTLASILLAVWSVSSLVILNI